MTDFTIEQCISSVFLFIHYIDITESMSNWKSTKIANIFRIYNITDNKRKFCVVQSESIISYAIGIPMTSKSLCLEQCFDYCQ